MSSARVASVSDVVEDDEHELREPSSRTVSRLSIFSFFVGKDTGFGTFKSGDLGVFESTTSTVWGLKNPSNVVCRILKSNWHDLACGLAGGDIETRSVA